MRVSSLSKIVGYALFGISCVFSVELFMRFATTGIDKLCWSALGVAFMSTEFLCSVIGLRLYLHKKMGLAALFGCLYCALYVVSLAGSLGFQSTTTTDADKLANASDEKKVMMSTALAQIDKEIEATEAQIKEYARRGMLTKGVKPATERIDRLLVKREELYNQLLEYKPTGGSSDQFWIQLANFAGSEDPESVKFSVFLLIAVLIDLSGAAMVCCGFETFRSFIEKEPSEAQFFGYETQPETGQATFRNQTVQEAGQNTGAKYQPFRDSGNKPERKPEKEPISEPMQPTPATAQTRTPIGFATPRTVQGTSTVQAQARYLDYAFSHIRKAGNFPSRRVIADKIGISQSEADQIHSLLKQRGLVRVDGIKTFPQCDEPEMLEKIG